ncbi:MAG: hypothetical protein WC455_06950 [Dehalococcoidia bacterium]
MTVKINSVTRWFRILSVVVLLAGMMAMMPAKPAEAATNSIIVNLYNTDSELVESITLNLTQIKALPVQGNGSTHYYHQGPTFNESDIWDESETVNLKDMGALKGADVKDFCEALNATVPSDAHIEIKASDSFAKTFDYDDIYNPEARQGKLVICYEKDGVEVSTWSDGMRLVFFADDCVFGNWDMHETLDEDEWHLYSGVWPSTHGLSVKYVSQINIYDQE